MKKLQVWLPSVTQHVCVGPQGDAHRLYLHLVTCIGIIGNSYSYIEGCVYMYNSASHWGWKFTLAYPSTVNSFSALREGYISEMILNRCQIQILNPCYMEYSLVDYYRLVDLPIGTALTFKAPSQTLQMKTTHPGTWPSGQQECCKNSGLYVWSTTVCSSLPSWIFPDAKHGCVKCSYPWNKNCGTDVMQYFAMMPVSSFRFVVAAVSISLGRDILCVSI